MSDLFVKPDEVIDPTDLIESLGLYKKVGSEYKGPCPFCTSGSEITFVEINGERIYFYGVDRFIISEEYPHHTYCRRCHSKQLGPKENGWRPFSVFAEKLGLSGNISELGDISVFSRAPSEIRHTPTAKTIDINDLALYTKTQKSIEEAKKFADTYGFTYDVVSRFMVSRLYLHGKYGLAIYANIFNGYTGDVFAGYYPEVRFADGTKRRPSGSIKGSYCGIFDDRSSTTIVVVEGMKDAVTAYQLGFKNILISLSPHWEEAYSNTLYNKGFRNLYIFTDMDEAGEDRANLFIEKSKSFVCYRPSWDVNLAKDLTELYQHFQTRVGNASDKIAAAVEKTRTFLLSQCLTPVATPVEDTEEKSNGFVYDVSEIDDLRADMYRTVSEFLSRNLNTKNGETLILKLPAGTGKTHLLIRICEEIAEQHLKKVSILRKDLEERIASSEDESEKEFLSRRLKRLTNVAIFWYGKYTRGWGDIQEITEHPEYWYNFVARNEDNCENLNVFSRIASNNQNTGKFCHSFCPLREMCQKTGYLSQFEELKKKPIVFFRHNHLIMNLDVKPLFIVIDENPHSIWEESLSIATNELRPYNSGWFIDIDSQQHQLMVTLIDSILSPFLMKSDSLLLEYSKSLEENRVKNIPKKGSKDEAFSISIFVGNVLYEQLDKFAKELGYDLGHILLTLEEDTLKAYHPDMFEENVYKRVIPDLIPLLRDEYIAWSNNTLNGGRVIVKDRKFTIYHKEITRIPNRFPVIVADATGSSIYEAMFFGRKLSFVEAEIVNPELDAVQIVGSDFSYTEFGRQAGKIYYQLFDEVENSDILLADSIKNSIEQRITAIRNGGPLTTASSIMFMDKKTMEVGEITVRELMREVGVDEDSFSSVSPMLKNIMAIFTYLPQYHTGEKILFVLPLKIKNIVLDLFGDYIKKIDNIVIEHYGSLRGTNIYETYPIVVLIGTFRIPYQIVAEKVSLWANVGGIDVDTNKLQILKFKEDEYFRFIGFADYADDEFPNELLNMIESGEMIQSMARIRPYTRKEKKIVYILSNREVIRRDFITKKSWVRSFVTFLTSESWQNAYKFIKDFFEENGKFPSYRLIKSTFRVGQKSVSKLFDMVSADLKVK